MTPQGGPGAGRVGGGASASAGGGAPAWLRLSDCASGRQPRLRPADRAAAGVAALYVLEMSCVGK